MLDFFYQLWYNEQMNAYRKNTSVETAKKHLGIYMSATPESAIGHLDDFYRPVYEGLFSELIKLGCAPVIVYNQAENYLGSGKFKAYWQVSEEDGKINFVHHQTEIGIAFLFDKNRFKADDVAVTDPSEVREICRDKYLSYLFAPEWHAKSFLIIDQAQLDAFFKSHSNEFVALKELDSNGGKKVFVGKSSEYSNSLIFPLLAQEFIDTSVGISGICEGRHDVRLIKYNDRIISFLLRQPPKDGFISNLDFGGNYAELGPSRVPAELVNIAKIIDARFNTAKDRLYCVDFGNTANGWKIFELNAWPGLKYKSDGDKAYMRRLAECLVESFNSQLHKSKGK